MRIKQVLCNKQCFCLIFVNFYRKRGKMSTPNKKNYKKPFIIISIILFILIFAINSYNVKAFCWHIFFCGSDDNHDPWGYLDNADCNHISGWTCDGDNLNIPLTVNFVVNDENGMVPIGIPNVLASHSRDLPYWACDGTPNHGFDFPTPDQLKTGKKYTIYAHASDDNPKYPGHIIGIGTALGPCGSTTPTSNWSCSLTPPPPGINKFAAGPPVLTDAPAGTQNKVFRILACYDPSVSGFDFGKVFDDVK